MVKCSKAEVRRLKTALRWKIPAAQRQRIQMVLLRESGMTQPAIAAAMGASLMVETLQGIESGEVRAVAQDEPLTSALESMNRYDLNQLPVISNGHLDGMLSRAQVLNYLQTHSEIARSSGHSVKSYLKDKVKPFPT